MFWNQSKLKLIEVKKNTKNKRARQSNYNQVDVSN